MPKGARLESTTTSDRFLHRLERGGKAKALFLLPWQRKLMSVLWMFTPGLLSNLLLPLVHHSPASWIHNTHFWWPYDSDMTPFATSTCPFTFKVHMLLRPASVLLPLQSLPQLSHALPPSSLGFPWPLTTPWFLFLIGVYMKSFSPQLDHKLPKDRG